MRQRNERRKQPGGGFRSDIPIDPLAGAFLDSSFNATEGREYTFKRLGKFSRWFNSDNPYIFDEDNPGGDLETKEAAGKMPFTNCILHRAIKFEQIRGRG